MQFADGIKYAGAFASQLRNMLHSEGEQAKDSGAIYVPLFTKLWTGGPGIRYSVVSNAKQNRF